MYYEYIRSIGRSFAPRRFGYDTPLQVFSRNHQKFVLSLVMYSNEGALAVISCLGDVS